MKKKIIVISILVLVAILATAGFVFAQSPTPPGGQGNVPGWMQQMHNRMMGGGSPMMGGIGGMGVMHDAMVKALADKLGLTVDEVNAQLNQGKTMYQIAEDKGLTKEQFQAWMIETHKPVINQLVADGKLSQQQADWMNSHMQQMIDNGYGPGSCPGWNGTDPDDAAPSSGRGAGRGGMMGGGMMRGWNTTTY